MNDDQADPVRRVVITASEIARADAERLPLPPASRASTVPWWGVLLGALAALCLPVLCAFSLAMRIALRGRGAALRQAWLSLLCSLLIVSGLITSAAVVYVWSLKAPVRPQSARLMLGLLSHDWTDSFPSLPARSPMTAVEIAAGTKPLVFIVVPDPGRPPLEDYLENAPLGAAVLLMADDAGYLLGTNRHVVDPPVLFGKDKADRVLVVSSQGSYAYAGVVGRHQSLDLALLWVARQSGRGTFRQPITPYAAIPVGSTVFVIGHPQRLYFSLSSGLVSRVGGDNSVQLSAPISPGNSGGPVYDSFGNLLAVVTSAVDKQTTPNAENLNFATRADAFLAENGWSFRDNGKAIFKRFLPEDPKRAR